MLARLMGQVLLVVAANKTPETAVKQAASLLGDDQAINVVFNGVIPFMGQNYRYGGYYGHNY